MMVELYHLEFTKEVEQSERLHNKWGDTYDSLKRTQESLQESRLHIDQIRKELMYHTLHKSWKMIMCTW